MKNIFLKFSISQVIILFIVWLAFLFSFIDRLAWAPIIPLVSKALSMNAEQSGSYMSAFYLGYIVTQIPGGYLADRFGYRKILLFSFLIMGIFTILMGTITSFWQGFFYRILAGIGSGAIFSACMKAIFDWFSESNRYTAVGIFMTASSLGVFFVNLIIPTVAKTYGWNISFYVAGLFPLLALFFGIFALKEKGHLADSSKTSSSNFINDILDLLKNKKLMITGLAGFLAMWGTWGTATWANTFMHKSLNLSIVEAGLFMSLYGFSALMCKPIIGIIMDITHWSKHITLSILLLLFGIVLVIFGINRNIFDLYFIVPILGILAFIYSPVMNTFVGELVNTKNIGISMGFINAFWQLGSLISPIIVGSVIDNTHNFFYVFLTLGAGPIIGSIIILFVNK